MAAPSLFSLPDEQFYNDLFQSFPCREQQIRTLTTLLHPAAAPCGNIVVHGTEATGKSVVTAALLDKLASTEPHPEPTEQPSADEQAITPSRPLSYAIVNSDECVTSRHLFERTVQKVADALEWTGPPSRRCESLAQLTVELSKMLKYVDGRPDDWRFVLVFDAIDRQRDTVATLLPGLARLSEIIPCLSTVFIVTFPTPNFLRTSFAPYIHFPNYTKAEFVELLARIASPPPPVPLPNATAEETAELWTRFGGAVHDALTKTAGRTWPVFHEACTALWPRFTAPVIAGAHGPRDFSKLLIASRSHFQDEALLDPGLVIEAAAATPPPAAAPTTASLVEAPDAVSSSSLSTAPPTPTAKPAAQTSAASSVARTSTSSRDLSALLPTTARLFLLCAYLASHNATKHDLTLFSTFYHGRKRRRGGGFVGARGGGGPGARSKHRKIARKLLGAHAFALERLLAIFAAVRSEWTTAPPLMGRSATAALVDGDAAMAIATLASLRLVQRVGAAGTDPMDRAGKWRVNVGWEVVRSLGRSMGIEMEDWLID